MRDDFGIAASSIAFAAFLAIIPLIGLIAVAYGVFVPATRVSDDLATLAAIMPIDAQRIVAKGLRNALAVDHASITTLLV